jgi:hypothetical protein
LLRRPVTAGHFEVDLSLSCQTLSKSETERLVLFATVVCSKDGEIRPIRSSMRTCRLVNTGTQFGAAPGIAIDFSAAKFNTQFAHRQTILNKESE